MKNRELFVRDPAVSSLINDGQARISEGASEQERSVLREELSHFVCEGKYADGMIRILESYLGSLGSTQQPAAWVSGFYGSGKSHLMKMLHHLWVNTEFPEDGATARTLVPELPTDIEAAFKELDTQGRRFGGLHAASGTLLGGSDSVRLAVLGIILRSMDLPETYAQARFCLYLRSNRFLDPVRRAVEAAGKEFRRELNNLYVSPVLHDALVAVDPGFDDRKAVRELLKKQFVQPADITTAEFIATVKEVLGPDGSLPCTVILLDEVQQYIDTSEDRPSVVVEVAEALSKEMSSRVLLVGAGQSALGASTRQLAKLLARFTIPIELQDQDVEAVTRKVLLAKKPDRLADLKSVLDASAGEVERQLSGTRIGPRSEDRTLLSIDYPLLPTRRRFWEAVLRAVDPSGTSSMLRAQLRIIHDALRDLAELPVGSVIAGDYIFEQLQAGMVQQGVLLRALDETIRKLDDGTPAGKLARRVCGLIFLIRRLPREGGADLGIRATSETLADLLVQDLKNGGATIRKDLPALLDKLVGEGVLLKDHDEYNLQTREYSEWDKEFRTRKTRIQADKGEVFHERDRLLRQMADATVKGLKLLQGESKEPRRITVHFGDDAPEVTGTEIPVWVRDGWNCTDKAVLDAARQAGADSPIVFVFVPKADDPALSEQIIQFQSAKETLEYKGTPSTDEGKEARNAMQGRMDDAKQRRDALVSGIVARARVFKGGGTEQHELTVDEKIRSAAEDSLSRLYPHFKEGDHKNWSVAIGRAKQGSDSPLEAVGWKGAMEQHPVCKEVMRVVGSGADGRTVERELSKSPFGWPKDAIDGALISLHSLGHLTARYSGAPVPPRGLDQAKVGRAEFRVETATISPGDKIKLKALFKEAGVSVKGSEDISEKSSEFIEKLERLAEAAGGEAPLPKRPDTKHLADLRGLAGNERLAKMLELHDELKKQASAWASAAELSASRMPEWKRLERLLVHGIDCDELTETRSSAESVRSGRLLLDTTDHAKPLVKKAAGVLRSAVNDAHKALVDVHDSEMQKLEATDAWKKITADQRSSILAEEGIADTPSIQVGSDDQLLATLDTTPLPSWRDKADALPKRFASAAMKAAKLLEPKTQYVRLSSSTLTTEPEVKAWVAEQEAKLLGKLAEGPIVIH
jgi:nucleotidyltransferase/DNA polymerase involved in DNA repair